MELISTELSDEDIMSAFNTFFFDDDYSFCLSDKRLKSIYTEHIEKTPKLNWCQLEFSNCKSKIFNITLDNPQSNEKFIKELNKFNFKTLKKISNELNLEDSGVKHTLKKRLIRLRIEHILLGKPIFSIFKI